MNNRHRKKLRWSILFQRKKERGKMKKRAKKVTALLLSLFMFLCTALPAGATEAVPQMLDSEISGSETPHHPEEFLQASPDGLPSTSGVMPFSASSGDSVSDEILEQNRNVRSVVGEMLLHTQPTFYSIFNGRNQNPGGYSVDELKAASMSIAGDSGSQYERAKKLYYWVATNISYGSVYSDPINIFRWRTGACEGYTSLLNDLLAAQGISSIAINVATNQTGQDWSRTVYNATHTVLLAALDGKVYWLDPTWDEKTSTHLEYFGQSDEEFSRQHFAMATCVMMSNAYLYGDELLFIDDEELFGWSVNQFTGGVRQWILDNGVLRASAEGDYAEATGWCQFGIASYRNDYLIDGAVYLENGLAVTGSQMLGGENFQFSSNGVLTSGTTDYRTEYMEAALNTDLVGQATYSTAQYTRFTLDHPSIVSFEYDVTSGSNVRMELFSMADDARLYRLWDDFYPSWETPEMYLDAGEYYFWIGGPYSSTFTYRINCRPDDGSVEREGNGIFESATQLEIGKSCSGYLASAQYDVDLYSFTLDSHQDIQIKTSHSPYGTDDTESWTVYLISESGAGTFENIDDYLIYADIATSNGGEYSTSLAPGKYYVLVGSDMNESTYLEGNPYRYDLTVQTIASPENGWFTIDGKDYWYENGVRQGTEGRGKEIYDPESDAWYWLDAIQGGAKAVDKEVYMDYLGMQGSPKWVRYDENGHMIKGWYVNENGSYYYDLITGAMSKGDILLDGVHYGFDQENGIMLDKAWLSIDGGDYWYENGIRQGFVANDDGTPDLSYRGEEIYDPASDGWYWLDNVDYGKKAVSKDVYQESSAGIWADRPDGTGKWVRYDENGIMIKGWSADGQYYFDPVYGTMAKGDVTIDGRQYHFDPNTGVLM